MVDVVVLYYILIKCNIVYIFLESFNFDLNIFDYCILNFV